LLNFVPDWNELLAVRSKFYKLHLCPSCHVTPRYRLVIGQYGTHKGRGSHCNL
jgi:hypothetical protein